MKLTIVTINYNNAVGLRKTMQSVLSQTSKDFEYIVVDGAAPKAPFAGTESDTEVLQTFIKHADANATGFTTCTWKSLNGEIAGGFYSEKDEGIYNAMNKGIRMAKGAYVHFLNSGDWMVDEFVVANMLKIIAGSRFGVGGDEERDVIDILVGKVISVRPDGKVLYKKQTQKAVTCFTFYEGTIEHTSAYIRRTLFDTYGLYDESLSIVADWKWYLNVVGLHNATVEFADIFVTYFDTSGISSTNLQLDKTERRAVLEELIPERILADYDAHHFDIDQIQRIKRYPFLYRIFWFVERVLFKLDKWNLKYWAWRKLKN